MADPGRRKQTTETVHGPKRLAEKVLRDRLAALEDGSHVAKSKETVAQFMEYWLDNYAASHCRPRTVVGYRGNVKRHISPSLSHIPVQSLTSRLSVSVWAIARYPQPLMSTPTSCPTSRPPLLTDRKDSSSVVGKSPSRRFRDHSVTIMATQGPWNHTRGPILCLKSWYPCPDSNRGLRFRKPLLYPPELQGPKLIRANPSVIGGI